MPARWFRFADWTGRNTFAARWGRRTTSATTVLITVSAVEDLVGRVLGGPEPLPRHDNELVLLIAGLRQHLSNLEQIAGKADRALVGQARRARESSPPVGHMPLVIHTIRLAEFAQALIDAVAPDAAPGRATGRKSLTPERQIMATPQDAAASPFDDNGPAAIPVPTLTPVAQGAGALHRRSARTGEMVSAAVGTLRDCGPPPG